MKKLLVIFLCMGLLLCSCGGEKEGNKDTSSAESKVSSETSSESQDKENISSEGTDKKDEEDVSSSSEKKKNKKNNRLDDEDENSSEEDEEVCDHNFAAATCLAPQKCTKCGETKGSALGHSFSGKTCTRCGENTPDVPKFVSAGLPIECVYSNPVGGAVYSKCTITNVKAEYISDKDGIYNVKLCITGICSNAGESAMGGMGSGNMDFGGMYGPIQIDLSFGYDVYDGSTLITDGIADASVDALGDSFIEKISISGLKEGKTYRVVFSDVKEMSEGYGF